MAAYSVNGTFTAVIERGKFLRIREEKTTG
jgi:hypothetical protein